MPDEILACDICGDPILAGDFVGLVRMKPNHYVVAQVGLKVGDMIDYDVYAHSDCVAEKGRQIGDLKVGRG